MKESDEILRSDSGCVSCIAVIILCIQKKFHSGILTLFGLGFCQPKKTGGGGGILASLVTWLFHVK